MSVPGEVKVHEHCSLLTAAKVPDVIARFAAESWEVWESATHPQEPEGTSIYLHRPPFSFLSLLFIT